MTKIHFVIHHDNDHLTIEQAAIAAAAGADGVFLISHRGLDEDVVEMAKTLEGMNWSSARKQEIGINLLATSPLDAVRIAVARSISKVWLDNSGVTYASASSEALAIHQITGMLKPIKPIEIFAGVAFKGQAHEPDPPAAAANADRLGFIPTTSGAATGIPPTVAMIKAMSEAAGGSLAIASGLTQANAAWFAPHVSDMLVASGISRDFHHFDPSLARAFVAEVRRVDADGSAPAKVETRPVDCRNRQRDDGKPYPKSGCVVCRTGGMTGCPYERAMP